MFKDTPDGQHHYIGDNCGEKAHNLLKSTIEKMEDKDMKQVLKTKHKLMYAVVTHDEEGYTIQIFKTEEKAKEFRDIMVKVNG